MSGPAPLLIERVDGVAHLTLNRPDKRNALDAATLSALEEALRHCAEDTAVRVVQIGAAGRVFCAGADLEEMRAQAFAAEEDNLAHAQKLAAMLSTLDGLTKPTIARVSGDGYGGALGIIAACDIAVVAQDARFAFTEVRLGIIPAVISPFVLAKISAAAASRYFLTAEAMSAAVLKEIGLAHEVVARESLDSACQGIAHHLVKGGPQALAAAKGLIREHAASGPRAEAALKMAARLAQLRVQAEATEGFSAFFDKRKPVWLP